MQALLKKSAIALLSLLFAVSISAQAAKSSAPPSHSQALLGVWNYEGNKLIAMAED